MKIHLIAIGGSAMHNLALALYEKGYKITGSDDEVFEPSRSRLENKGLLPLNMGWFPEKITPELDAVLLGMHAREDNPELQRARELGLKIYSYPEYLYEQSKEKIRVVVGGSHGKTTITSMIMHVLRCRNIDFDYMVGAQVEGFDTMVRLSERSDIAVFEGDEYLSSPLDPRPKFHLYHPHIAIISGIAWDHINVFPTFENYVYQFETFINLIERGGELIYCETDPILANLATKRQGAIKVQAYTTHPYITENHQTKLITPKGLVPLEIFGEHNLQNINAAFYACLSLGVTEDAFYQSISSFKGAAKRLQTLAKTAETQIFLDFAHSPSKLKATVHAVKEQFPERKLTACMELHTFSSLTEAFLEEYRNCMDEADTAIVYYNPETIEHKRLRHFDAEKVREGFGRQDLLVFTDSKDLTTLIKSKDWAHQNLLIMTSGNFNGVSFTELAKEIIEKL